MIWDPYPVDQASSSFDTMPVDLARSYYPFYSYSYSPFYSYSYSPFYSYSYSYSYSYLSSLVLVLMLNSISILSLATSYPRQYIILQSILSYFQSNPDHHLPSQPVLLCLLLSSSLPDAHPLISSLIRSPPTPLSLSLSLHSFSIPSSSLSFLAPSFKSLQPIILDHLYPPPPHRSSIETRLRAHRHSIISPH